MPSVVLKTANEKGAIAMNAKNTVKKALEVCLYDNFLDILIDVGCKSDNATLQEHAYTFCGLFVKNAGGAYFAKALDSYQNQTIIKLTNQLYVGTDAMPKV